MRKPRTICAGCPALEEGLCGALREEELSRLNAVTWHRRFRSGQVIHAEGEVPPAFCAIISGVVKLMKSLPNGSQQIVGLAGPGDFLGRPFGGEARASAIAAGEVKLCWFPRAMIEGLASQSSAVKDWLFEHVADELEKAQEWIMLLGRMTAEQKMAAFLLSVARGSDPQGAATALPADTVVELPISRTEIADYLGLTIETVSRQIGRLRERGVVTVGNPRRVIIHRPEALEATVESALPGERAKEPLRI
jgi:CRP/FNR family transcriptional regulator, anaerobic regulatory protein